MQDDNFTPIQKLGFPALMKKLRSYAGSDRSELLVGSTERVSVMDTTAVTPKHLLSSSGVFMEGVHFDLVYTPLEHLGFKLLTAISSRICAVNGRPLAAYVSVAVPNKISVQMIENLFSGFDSAGKEYGCAVLPADITASRQTLSISVTLTGYAEEEKLITPGGTRSGEQICVTGDIGGAMAGLRVLLREKQAWQESGEENFQPDLQEYEYVIGRQLKPRARFDFLDALQKSGVVPTSMLDVSQGLLNELQLIVSAGSIGCEVFTPALPVAPETRNVADEMKEDVDRYAYYGGEDFEILFILGEADVARLQEQFVDFSVIGEVKSAEHGIVLHTGEGDRVQIDLSR